MSVESLDPGALAQLASDADPDAARAFAQRYVKLLDGRISRIWDAIGELDTASATDSLLSLRSASSTVGATELVSLASAMYDDVRALDLVAARGRAVHLREAGARAHRALALHLHQDG